MKISRNILLALALVSGSLVNAQSSPGNTVTPLSEFSPKWNDPVYAKCNTAKTVSYMNSSEKQVIWILNMVKTDPQLFLRSVLLNPRSRFYVEPSYRSTYYNSLVEELKGLAAAPQLIKPDKYLFEKAYCHSFNSGKAGYVGHVRSWPGCTTGYAAECCSYGYKDPMDIVVQLLIDDGVPSLGHREVCLSYVYNKMGVSIQPHKTYEFNAVLDLL